MKRNVLFVMPFSGLLLAWLAMPSCAIEAHELIVRNGLGRPVHLEISENTAVPEMETYHIQARWEVQLKKVKVDLSDPGALRVRLTEADSKPVMCRTHYTTFSADPKVAVVISQASDALQCDTVDLKGSPSVDTSSLQQSVILSRLALKN